MSAPDPLEGFHPAVREWFRRNFPDGPTEAQALGWGPIAKGKNTLIAAPTGSGKTLAAFLVAIDRCFRLAVDNGERLGTSVVYISPLRALTVDVQTNLETPLREITEIADELGIPVPPVRVAVRNGDSTTSERAAIIRNRPEIIVTTPESLYLLLTARRGREVLKNVSTVIVDEIHALARDKRGSHLALSLERLDRLVATVGGSRRPTRIGCSATQRPIATIARLLVGSGDGRSEPSGAPLCHIVDVGHRRLIDVDLVLPEEELGAVMTNSQLDQIVASLAELIRAHRTTLVFVNTRKMSERIAHLLVDELGDDAVSAHHGSLSTRRRLAVEGRLRNGELRAVIATASLELGIDIGPVELVCQIGSPRSIATFLQRIGRAEHRRDGVPKGRLYPVTRDELVECVALLGAVRAGALDVVVPPVAPLDILAQQVVAECAAAGDDGIEEDELFALVRHATPYAALPANDFEAILELVSNGVSTGRGTRGAHVARDIVNGVLRPRRGARLTAATSGGAIPELADYRVVTEPDAVVVGTVHEDFAVEAMAGDVFLLGSTSWRIRRVEQGTVRVIDAEGAAPTIPFWLGEAPARTFELAKAVSDLREMIATSLVADDRQSTQDKVMEWSAVTERPARELVAYLAAAWTELGTLPTLDELVFERFFDDTGGMQLVVHSPYGARVNRGLGLALRKRFCRTFDFELQAAASDDAVVLSLGPQHAFALDEVPRYLAADSVREVLIQAVLPTPIFTARWRWNLGRSLISPRFRGARHLPPAIQRMEADDLMAAIFPALTSCQENGGGPIVIPDHPIVRQTLTDCLTESMDIDGLITLVGALRSGTVRARCVDTSEPSVLTHEILNGRPYTFLDDAPLEERRTRAVSVRRGIPIEARNLTTFDPAAIDQVEDEIVPDPRDAEELHDLLCTLVVMDPNPSWQPYFDTLVGAHRAAVVDRSNEDPSAPPIRSWCAIERRLEIETLFARTAFSPDLPTPRTVADQFSTSTDSPLARTVGGHLEYCGPRSAVEIGAAIGGISTNTVLAGLAELESRGKVVRVLADKWCARRLAQRIHAVQRDRERTRFPPIALQHLMRFLLQWQHVTPETKVHGVDGVAAIVGQLQGVEAPVGAWEDAILPARVHGYHSHLLDELCAHGEVTWGRLSVRNSPGDEPRPRRSGATPSQATPVALVRRDDLAWLMTSARGETRPGRPTSGAAEEILDVLESRGALFFSDLCTITERLPTEVAEALWDGVARGWLTSDGFQAVRALLSGRYRNLSASTARTRSARPYAIRRISGRANQSGRPLPGQRNVSPALAGGRWSIIDGARPEEFAPDELSEAIATQLLERWGIVFFDLFRREQCAIDWREVLWALRRFEARGVVRGGRFVEGVVGEQYALPDALDALRATARRPADGTTVRLSATDPLNLTGIVLAGPRTPAVRGNSVFFVDGLPKASTIEDTSPKRMDLLARH